MPVTPWATREAGFVLLEDHVAAQAPEWDYHMWVWIPGYRGDPVYMRRDWLGRATTSPDHEWVVMMCNNGECPARALVRAQSHLATPLQMWLPVPPTVN